MKSSTDRHLILLRVCLIRLIGITYISTVLCSISLSLLITVCSDAFHKCYRYFNGNVQAHDYCSSLDNPDQQPVRIQSEVEDDFVIYHLTHGVNASLPYSQLLIGKVITSCYICYCFI